MTEIEKIINQMQISPNDFCERFKIPKRTLAHWIKGDRKPPNYVISLLQQVAKYENKRKD